MTKSKERAEALEARLADILEEAMLVEGAAWGKIRVVDPETGGLAIHVQRGFSEPFLKRFAIVGLKEEHASSRAARLKRRVTVPDIANDERAEPYRLASEGFKAMQSTPIIGSEGDVLGTLSTHFPRVCHPTRAAMLVLDFCARRAAAYIEDFFGKTAQPETSRKKED